MDKALTFERFYDKLFTQEVFDVVYTIEQIRDIAVPIARSYGVSSLSLFGSYACGEATEDSDIDIIGGLWRDPQCLSNGRLVC